ncbi:MAG: guanylate kinase [Gammaproteobacteria bacterium RIFCSPHIGHO2_12_FULL_37_14]|nr:MAG: guanylate kinase [Gammaproteobacteria bacterium RIFCSPHIGHO2_12_FULL_37_14]
MSYGNLYVIAAPSGTGKTTLVKALIESSSKITVSISHTTRPKRPNEMNGVNYYFIDPAEFKKMIHDHQFLEHAVIFDYYYGTSKWMVEETLAKGIDVILEIDWQGHQQIQHLFPLAIGIFILPPSMTDLRDRLIKRNQDDPNIILKRLADVKETVSHINEFDYVVINDDFTTALDDLKTIIHAERLRQHRQSKNFADLIDSYLIIKND